MSEPLVVFECPVCGAQGLSNYTHCIGSRKNTHHQLVGTVKVSYFSEGEVRPLVEALEDLAGDSGCTVAESPDPSMMSNGQPCRERRPDQRDTWCYACLASEALENFPTPKEWSGDS